MARDEFFIIALSPLLPCLLAPQASMLSSLLSFSPSAVEERDFNRCLAAYAQMDQSLQKRGEQERNEEQASALAAAAAQALPTAVPMALAASAVPAAGRWDALSSAG